MIHALPFPSDTICMVLRFGDFYDAEELLMRSAIKDRSSVA